MALEMAMSRKQYRAIADVRRHERLKMVMSKKHYKAIADVLRLRAGESPAEQQTVLEAAQGLATVFEKDNPRFDRERFLEAVRGEY